MRVTNIGIVEILKYESLVNNLNNKLLLPMSGEILMRWDIVCVIIWNIIIISADVREIIWMRYKWMVDNYIIF